MNSMQSAKLDDKTHLIRLERGEEVVDAIKTFCQTNSIKNATLSALGSIENPTLAHYNVNNKQYSEKKLEGIFELTSLLGNIALFENGILPHCHVIIANENMQAWGGHLINATVSATVEMTVTVYETSYEKKLDEGIGLKLWELHHES